MRYIKCDLCKAGPVKIDKLTTVPDGWIQTEFRLPAYVSLTFDVCPQCSKRIGLPEVKKTTPQDDLYDLVVGLVEEAIEDNQ